MPTWMQTEKFPETYIFAMLAISADGIQSGGHGPVTLELLFPGRSLVEAGQCDVPFIAQIIR